MRILTGFVSIVIPSYNAADFLQRAIDSALAQDYPYREIIVVDDGSTDNTSQILPKYKDTIQVIHQPNNGLSNARNMGIHAAQGEFIAFLDADDRWLPTKLSRQVELMSSNPKIGFCSTATRLEGPQGELLGEWRCCQSNDSFLHMLFARNAAVAGSGSSVMVRQILFERTGLFDESLDSLEDIDMWMRLAAISAYSCINEPLTIILKLPQSMSRNLHIMRTSALKVMHKNRYLLPPEDRHQFWQSAYAGVLTDYAKWEYRAGHKFSAISHLLEAFLRAPFKQGRLTLGLLTAMALRRHM